MSDIRILIGIICYSIRLLYELITWRVFNNLFGLPGLLLGILSMLLAYWAVRLTKKSSEAILEFFDHKAYVVQIGKNYYLFAQIVMRNLGGAWLKLIQLARTGTQVRSGKWVQNFIFDPHILTSKVWSIAREKFDYAINLERINNNPEITLYPNGASIEFYFIGKSEGEIDSSIGLSKNAFLDIDYQYETERGVIKHRGAKVELDLVWSAGPGSIRSFTITIPVEYNQK